MINLIRAHFARLLQSPVFWLGTAASAASGVLLWFPNAAGLAVLPPLYCAVVFSLFFGTEYADGTIRNKLIAGHSREAIYLAALATAAAVMWLFLALSSPGIFLTARLYPSGRYAPGQGALAVVTVVLASAAVAAVLTCLCMLVHKRAVLALALVFLVLGSVMTASAVYDELQGYAGYWTVEYVPTAPAPGELPIESYGVTDEGPALAQNVYVPPEKPPAWLTFFVHVLPAAQVFRAVDPENFSVTWTMPLCSLAEAGLATALGLALFKRKDIK